MERTIAVSAEKAFSAFTDPSLLSRWFTKKAKVDLRVGGRYKNSDGDHGTFLEITPGRKSRFTWENKDHAPGSLVAIDFYPRGKDQVTVQIHHYKMGTSRQAQDLKEGWQWALRSLQSFLETGTPIPYEQWVKQKRGRKPVIPSVAV